jgi:hypothetical protein
MWRRLPGKGMAMGELFKEYPFTFAFALAFAGTASWLGMRWYVIVIALVVGMVIGIALDKPKG